MYLWLYSYGLYSHGLCSYGLCSYGLRSHSLCSYGLCSHGQVADLESAQTKLVPSTELRAAVAAARHAEEQLEAARGGDGQTYSLCAEDGGHRAKHYFELQATEPQPPRP